ncbi:hypothetical protein FLW53_09575 [Microbispora sp. SCL1-1]|uniref:hypothetical protein n=1 Tax=unclassified Microbispora TaxID=2614687 RepID=UPI0011574614|nr:MULTISPECIES: hypothetical protein [unclassified Microbispora]NJP24453.1 hypothetical protein [Microbispora sp. CL1-1]TQS14599.1 hypothetical protein FLW53_09575 [Microbispora sp. SCL1-1]
MPVMEGTRGLKEARGEYDFAVDGGAVGTIVLRSAPGDSNGNDIPNGSLIMGGYIEVDTIPTSGGAATIAVASEGAGDLQTAAAISGPPWSTTGRKAITPVFTAATGVKTTARRNLAIAVATAALTAGKFRVVVFYR